MFYLSTRNEKIRKTPAEAILQGIARDGGLYMPESFEALKFPMDKLASMSAKEISAKVLELFFGDSSMFPESEDKNSAFNALVERAYGSKFAEGDDYAPLSAVDGAYVMELYHGPTCAFKDVALQILPHLIVEAKRSTKLEDEIVILTATSGDTGGAALSGFSDIDGIKIIVFYPKNGTSTVQERQMVSCEGKNTCVCAVVGNFDDAQSGVKKIFAELALPEGVQLSSANSINIGRLAPQVAYYFKTYSNLLNMNKIKMGDKVNFIVPTGNFGDILAGLFAKKMGLPVGKLVCASNENKVLTEFFESGTYNKNRAFHVTKSPSMDILISSNLERLLYIVCGAEKCAAYMKDLNTKGEYTITSEELAEIRELIDAGYADDKASYETIKSVYEKDAYLMDTHTAVAWNVYERWLAESKNEDTCVVLSTASAYKFASSVMNALDKDFDGEFDAVNKLNAYTGVKIPYGLDGIESRKIIHKTVLEKGEMLDFVGKMIAKKTW